LLCVGLGAIGVKGSSLLHYQLRAADKVVSALADLSIDDVLDVIIGSYDRMRYNYQLVYPLCGHLFLISTRGPEPEAASVPVLEKTTVRSVSAPAMDARRKKQDTFADEVTLLILYVFVISVFIRSLSFLFMLG
jgi:hypothetical protein